MCRIAQAEFAADSSAPSAARHWVSGLLDRWELSSLSDMATLLTSELATNAVRHTRSAPTVTAAAADGVLEIAVADRDPNHLPGISHAQQTTQPGGRGLAIVETLAQQWGTKVLPQGKQVWFHLGIRDWSYRSACRCPSDDPDMTVLASGTQVLANAGPWDDI
jgi:anti-sigma regulatory factor (Ser/Thr protein kinase)